MKPFLIDTHTHTVASGHAYSTVDEMARFSSEKRLEIIGITDHGSALPGGAHDFHFHNLRVIPKNLYGVRILKGIEANIIDFEGGIDVSTELLENLDIVIASFHPPCIPFNNEEIMTKTLIKIMENPSIDIIGHPGDARYPLDMKRIAEVARETSTLLEINNASLKPESFRPGVRENLVELLKWCKYYETPVIAGTDAHICYDVGSFKESIALFEELSFPEYLIMNTEPDKFLEFISIRD